MCETSGMIRHGALLGTEQDRASTATAEYTYVDKGLFYFY